MSIHPSVPDTAITENHNSASVQLSEAPSRHLGNDTGQPNPTGSRVRVSSGSGAGHGESTRDPGPTHLKGNSQRRPTKANAGQRRPTAAKEGQCRPTKNRYVFFCNVHFIFYFLFFNYYD